MNGHRRNTATAQRGPLFAVSALMVFVVLLAFSARPGAAAQLSLLPGSLTSLSLSERCTQALTATHDTATTGEASTVTVSGLGAACAGRDLDLTLYGSDGEALTAVSTSLAADTGASTTVMVPAYTPTQVAGIAATVGTWGVPAAWTYTPPVTPSELVSCTVLNDPTGTKTCQATDLRIEAWGYPQADNFNFFATVTSPSESEDVEWQLTINLADPEFQLLANRADSNNAVTLAPEWSCASMPVLELRGQAAVSTKYVGGGKTVTVWLHGMAAAASTAGGNLFTCP